MNEKLEMYDKDIKNILKDQKELEQLFNKLGPLEPFMAGLELGNPDMAIVSAKDIKDVRGVLKNVFTNLETVKVQLENLKTQELNKANLPREESYAVNMDESNEGPVDEGKKVKMNVKSKKS
jgi:hypothetical protein